MTISAEVFRELEQSLHRPEVRSSPAVLEALLADDFSEIGASGTVYDRRTTIEVLLREPAVGPARLPVIHDLTASALTDGVVLVTYRSVRKVEGVTAEQSTLRSSLWVFDQGHWRMRFHQGTRAP